MDEDLQIEDQNGFSKYTIKPDNYGNSIIIYTPEPDAGESAEKTAKLPMKSLAFSNFCKLDADGTKKLSLNGKDLFTKIGRRLIDNDVTDLENFLRENPEISKLNLAYNEIHCDGFISIINFIAREKQVVELNVQNNEIRSKGIDRLCELAEELQLKSLNLNGNKIGVESSKKIALLLRKNRHVKHLEIAEIDQTASSLVFFTSALTSENNTLKVLDISRSNPGCIHYFDSEHFSTLLGAMLKYNNSIEELYLRKFSFSCHDIENMLSEGRSNKTLLLLDLGCNNIGNFGVEIIANWLKERPALSALVLNHNIITNTGARALSYGLSCSKIRHLDVSYNRINDSGITRILDALKKSPPIQSLRIFGNRIGCDTAKIVHRMLLSGVLFQEYLDVRPYKLDSEWLCARYSASPYKQKN